jgi:thioredoxin-like negative regulator of GroEL
MSGAAIRSIPTILACVVAALAAAPIAAQTVEELDQLIQASAKPKEGLALARAQVGAGEWLDALASLERVLAAEPKHKQARLLHASILCRLDDVDGAKVEFAKLKSGDYKKAEWAEATAPCNALKGTGS